MHIYTRQTEGVIDKELAKVVVKCITSSSGVDILWHTLSSVR